MTDEFSEQRPVTQKMFPFDDIIMVKTRATCSKEAVSNVSIALGSVSALLCEWPGLTSHLRKTRPAIVPCKGGKTGEI